MSHASKAAKAAFHWDDPLLLEHQLTDDERAAAWAYVAAPTPPDKASANRARSLASLPLERLRTVLAAGTPGGVAARLETT